MVDVIWWFSWHFDRSWLAVQMLVLFLEIFMMAMAGFDSDDNMSLAGLTQET